jgi:myo-inositol-1(or 4)-monophosphatase
MTEDTLHELRDTAETAARAAGKLLRQRFNEARTIEYKSAIDLVTDADRASEALLISHIQKRHPKHAILAEESGFTRGTDGGLRWLVDPLDGTTNYSHHLPHFSVSVAVEGPRGLLAGAIYDPMRDELFSAARGLGATLNGGPIQATRGVTVERSLLCTGFPYDVHQHPDVPLGLFSRMLRMSQGVRRLGSAALDLCYVASGRLDGFFEIGLKPWDIAAGALIVWEAGGEMTQIDGAPLDLSIGDVLATGPDLHPALAKACAEVLAEAKYVPRSRLEPAAPTPVSPGEGS